MILVVWNNMRLCQDDRWRVFANYGTYSSCVKIYKSFGAAKNKAKKIGGNVAVIPAGLEIDAAGQIIPESGTWEKGKIRHLDDFIVN